MKKSDKDNYSKSERSNQFTFYNAQKILGAIQSSYTYAKAITMLKLLPYIPKEKQTTRELGKILGVSRETISNWITNYGSEILKKRGGEK